MERVSSIGDLCFLLKGNIHGLALMARQGCSLISEQSVHI